MRSASCGRSSTRSSARPRASGIARRNEHTENFGIDDVRECRRLALRRRAGRSRAPRARRSACPRSSSAVPSRSHAASHVAISSWGRAPTNAAVTPRSRASARHASSPEPSPTRTSRDSRTRGPPAAMRPDQVECAFLLGDVADVEHDRSAGFEAEGRVELRCDRAAGRSSDRCRFSRCRCVPARRRARAPSLRAAGSRR